MRLLPLLAFFLPVAIHAQVILGTVLDDASNDPIPGAVVSVQGSPIQSVTDFDGNFELRGMVPGLYNVVVGFIGYEGKTQFEVQVTQAKPAVVNFRLGRSRGGGARVGPHASCSLLSKTPPES